MVDWAGLAERKYRIKEREAETARMRAQAEQTQVEAMYGHGSLSYGGLAGEELARKHPYGLPAKQAETARISATGYAGAATRGAKTAARRLELEREESIFAREYLPGKEKGDDVSAIKGIATGEERRVAKPGDQVCPEGFTWDGRNCIPLI